MSVYPPSTASVFLALTTAIVVAEKFKKAFESARDNNAKLAGVAAAPRTAEDDEVETAESDREDKTDGNAPETTEENTPAAETEEPTKEE
jgi:hypothetical protein